MHDVALQDPPPKSVRPSPPQVPALKLKGIVNPTFEGLGGGTLGFFFSRKRQPIVKLDDANHQHYLNAILGRPRYKSRPADSQI
jgi:hypothetical protein